MLCRHIICKVEYICKISRGLRLSIPSIAFLMSNSDRYIPTELHRHRSYTTMSWWHHTLFPPREPLLMFSLIMLPTETSLHIIRHNDTTMIQLLLLCDEELSLCVMHCISTSWLYFIGSLVTSCLFFSLNEKAIFFVFLKWQKWSPATSHKPV